MAFVTALQKLFKDYKTLLNAYKPNSLLKTPNPIRKTPHLISKAPAAIKIYQRNVLKPHALGQFSFGCRDNNMCIELKESPNKAENTF